MSAKDYSLNLERAVDPATDRQPTAHEHVWAFHLDKASLGEAGRGGTEFEHQASRRQTPRRRREIMPFEPHVNSG